jgi:transcriptional regulator with XRE-family HTH domain
MAQTKKPANVVGPQVRKLRNKLQLTQEQFAARCQLGGLDISRGTLSQIEATLRSVRDNELFLLASILRVRTDDLYPADMRKRKGR